MTTGEKPKEHVGRATVPTQPTAGNTRGGAPVTGDSPRPQVTSAEEGIEALTRLLAEASELTSVSMTTDAGQR